MDVINTLMSPQEFYLMVSPTAQTFTIRGDDEFMVDFAMRAVIAGYLTPDYITKEKVLLTFFVNHKA
jgi:hypothetical protein